MSVYVDSPGIWLGRMRMCHMVADSLEELHAMAEQLGLRAYFQARSSPHYDICKTKRQRAIELGAIEIDRRQLVTIIRRLRLEALPILSDDLALWQSIEDCTFEDREGNVWLTGWLGSTRYRRRFGP